MTAIPNACGIGMRLRDLTELLLQVLFFLISFATILQTILIIVRLKIIINVDLVRPHFLEVVLNHECVSLLVLGV